MNIPNKFNRILRTFDRYTNNQMGKTYTNIQFMEGLPRPSNICFVSPRSQEPLILAALQLGHNVSLIQQPKSAFSAKSFSLSCNSFISSVQGFEQIDMFTLDRN